MFFITSVNKLAPVIRRLGENFSDTRAGHSLNTRGRSVACEIQSRKIMSLPPIQFLEEVLALQSPSEGDGCS